MDAVNTVHAFAFLEKPVSAEALEEQLQAFLRLYRKVLSEALVPASFADLWLGLVLWCGCNTPYYYT